MHDAFICHASEDKKAFVRPLAKVFDSWRVDVWFDEFSLRPGDSLSGSIDRGLRESRFGVVVLSKAFFAKHWPDYELRGLISLGVNQPNRIVPVWRDVSHNDVVAFSPPLADKVAVVVGSRPVVVIAYELLATIRPDLHENLTRYLIFLQKVETARTAVVPAATIKRSPIRHKVLPKPLLARINIVHAVFAHLFGLSPAEMIDNFKRDLHPEREILVWEGMAAAFLGVSRGKRLSAARRRSIAMELLRLSAMPPKSAK